MKPALRARLTCPTCRSDPLALEVFESDAEEIMEGVLSCTCGVRYPIIGGVPRMLVDSLLDDLPIDYPEFFQRHREHFPRLSSADDSSVARRSQQVWGELWTWADDYDADNFLDWLPERIAPSEIFEDRVGLEVGCGAGRHAAFSAGLAKEHFAVDLSRAVDSAFALNRNRENYHIIQADAFNLPFTESSFDYVYCLGVLQHMVDPVAGFRHLAKQPREGGVLLVNVYQASRPVTLGMLELVRKVTTRLPHPLLRRLSFGAGVADYGLFIMPWRHIRKTLLGRIARPLVPQRIDEYTRWGFDTCVADWFDRLSCPVKLHYRREDMLEWYDAAGYADVVVTPYWKAFWNGFGRRLTSA